MAAPTIEPEVKKISNLFTLYYKRGQTMTQLVFISDSLKTAIEKGKEYCAEGHLRFQNVVPLAQDIDELIASERSRR
jgi:hypothetical protein